MADPLPGYPVTTPFGVPGSWAAGYHTGEDRSTHGKENVPVHAAADAKVIYWGWDESYGWHVRLQTGDVQHWYCHLNDVTVDDGDDVSAGEVVAKSGNTGNSTGPHLHYEERVPPFGYHDHRKPELPYQEDDVALTDEDCDRIASAVWNKIKTDADGDEKATGTLLVWAYEHAKSAKLNTDALLDRD